MTAFRIFCDDAELAVELARSAHADARPELAEDPCAQAGMRAQRGDSVAVALAATPSAGALVGLAHASRASGKPILLCMVGDDRAARDQRHLAADLGLVVVDEVGPLIAAMALLTLPAAHPWTASTRRLQALDRIRLGDDATVSGRGGGQLLRADDGLIGWAAKGSEPSDVLGRPRDVGHALRALRLRTLAAPPARAVIEGVDRRAVSEVLFGPPRALSDPASKTALEPYGLPLPLEELCSSPSRAASEAARIGFPVRISLASPDLRLWDHPDLAVDGVDNAARVRDVYRQIMAMASERQPDARLLGVHVTATTRAAAMLRVEARPLPGGFVHATLGFADPHGRAARDQTETVLPAGPESIERVVGRLAGADLLLAGPPAHRRASVQALSDVLLRLAAFVDDLRDEVERVELHPLALLVGGSTEVREACVTVGDAYLRSLEAPRETGT
ncbi:MAG: acetate--CoA ligase family protein [Sandaracinaceae bacterium]